jgi:hypothetical protein
LLGRRTFANAQSQALILDVASTAFDEELSICFLTMASGPLSAPPNGPTLKNILEVIHSIKLIKASFIYKIIINRDNYLLILFFHKLLTMELDR